MSLRLSPARAILALCLLAGLGACATAAPPPPLSAQDYSTMQTALRDSAEARGELQRLCTSNLARKPGAEREMMAAFLDIEPARLDSVFCERVIAGMARKEISYEDFVKLSAKHADPEAIRRLMRVLRHDPGEMMI